MKPSHCTGYFTFKLANNHVVNISIDKNEDLKEITYVALDIKDVDKLIKWLENARKLMSSFIDIDGIKYSAEEAKLIMKKIKEQLGES